MKNTTCNNSSRSVWQLLAVLLVVLAALVAALVSVRRLTVRLHRLCCELRSRLRVMPRPLTTEWEDAE